jgi:hypothetical protein
MGAGYGVVFSEAAVALANHSLSSPELVAG